MTPDSAHPTVHHLPGEKMSGLKRTSKAVLLMEPTALHALRITSRLRGSAVETWPAGRQPIHIVASCPYPLCQAHKTPHSPKR